MAGTSLYTSLFGRNYRVSISSLIVGLAIAILFTVLTYTPAGQWLSSTHYSQLLVIVTFGAATVNAYLNSGFFLSWFLAASGLLPFAFSFALTDAPLGREPTIISAINTLLLSVGLYTVVVGTAAFILGVGVRHVHDRLVKPKEPLQSVE
ncbi:hypothetical protein [Haladaptatus salinisoli]|uniref:hypothetical protein n=1 Tax=Haladaptatus salinisoli TaxID=2884876 RepID=UPI001D0A16EB|nr:hypothetical protein [Haladaptatus salinisoli]